ncbi:peptidase S24/S26A/S26B/S26C [Aspergillus californicus]
MPPKLPKFRVLSPNAAKARSTPPSQPSAPKSIPIPPFPSTLPKTPPNRSRPSLFSSLKTRYASIPRSARQTLGALGVLAPIVPIGIFFLDHIMQPMWVRGPSMTPYLNENHEVMHTERDLIIVRMWPLEGMRGGLGSDSGDEKKKKGRRIERGMVVTIRSPANPSHVAIKRIIGLPGDRIYTREPCLEESQIVPFNHVWLEGDAQDPDKTLDSNTYGPVSVSLITGQVMAVLAPRFRWLDWESWERGVVEGDTDGVKFGDDYRGEVRRRVVKGAVQLERPQLVGRL